MGLVGSTAVPLVYLELENREKLRMEADDEGG